tara:strand:+ start:3628 stop:4602 length:975 start_codon:yes stop_codon:yes gene_type:complete
LYNILLVGSGQLGSRYLQGLSRFNTDLEIFVVDPNLNALSIAKDRFEKMPKNTFSHEVNYFQNINELGNEFDLGIIATNADVRKKILISLLSQRNIKNFILEKVVFQTIEDFEVIIELLNKGKIKAWINCPRRTMPFFLKLKEEIPDQSIIRMFVKGSNWGLASNTIHMLDLLSFLSDQVHFKFDISNLDKKIYNSKRNSFIEIGGKINFFSNRGDKLELVDEKGKNKPFEIIIEFEKRKIHINQDLGFVKILSKEGLELGASKFVLPMQSEITKQIVKDILVHSDSNLTPFSESFILHQSMIEAFNSHLTKIKGKKVNICPIT